jgi:hypothetical protein
VPTACGHVCSSSRRHEILAQALATFRHVLRDGAFGELLAGGSEPASPDHLFATIQSFNARRLMDQLGPNHWDHVVIDECHHAPAASYRAVVGEIRPGVLVGLTATPERADGQSLLPDFGDHVGAELRLWHALERQLLAPFEYYGVSDNTDLRDVRWARGAYLAHDLEKVYTGNDRRAELVIAQTAARAGNVRQMRALGFCVSVAHAEFMAHKFTAAGIPALAVHGGSDETAREAAPRRLERRDVNVLFTCDLYNEGVDLPFVDTLLLLRPTSSATLFMQQLGRGLRLHEGKSSCLVLDFIGQHHECFRFDGALSAMTGLPRGSLRQAVERGFPTLPSGCHLELDRVARTQVLASLSHTLRGGVTRLAEELRALVAHRGNDARLADFLRETGRELDEVFAKNRVSWSAIRRAAGLAVPPAATGEPDLTRRLSWLLHVDEPERLALYRSIVADSSTPVPADRLSRRRLLMLAYQMFHERAARFTAEAIVGRLREHAAVCAELAELFDVLSDQVALATTAPAPDEAWPLAVHRRYGRREILTAVGWWTDARKPESREGVVRLPDNRVELLFVTLDKSEKRFSPTTSYEDYAISPELFHWQSQSLTSADSESGRRYREQAKNGWRFLLFVRPTVRDVYTYLGPVRYVSHRGSRPLSITWRMETPIPGRFLRDLARLTA